MLACARIGAPHTVVFGGFSAQALIDRIHDCDARVVITADGGYRRGAPAALKPAVDEACRSAPTSATCWWYAVPARTSTGPTAVTCGGTSRRKARHRAHARGVRRRAPAVRHVHVGTTGKPKGILHTTGGYLVGTSYTHWAVFDLKPETDVFWTAADIGWVTGHSYIVYGPLANGTTSVMYEGTPGHPAQGPLVGDHREVQGQHPLLRADRDPHVHEVGRRDPGEVRHVVAAAASGRSASRSTPRPTSGTARPSAATAARWSTPGGRPRPA